MNPLRVTPPAGCFTGAALLVACACAAQDFTSPASAGPAASSLAYLETALPSAMAGIGVDAGLTRWYGLSDLTTRAAGFVLGWRSLRFATGVSQTADPAIGWTSVALACGAARREGGVALRGEARRDRDPESEAFALGNGVGAEAGGGVWIEAARGLRLWSSAPQLWSRGNAPPLSRALELGGSLSRSEIEIWFAREAPSRTSDGAGTRRAGLALERGPFRTWLEVRDRPLRAGAGVMASVRGLELGIEVETHPVLGETTRISIGAGTARGSR